MRDFAILFETGKGHHAGRDQPRLAAEQRDGAEGVVDPNNFPTKSRALGLVITPTFFPRIKGYLKASFITNIKSIMHKNVIKI